MIFLKNLGILRVEVKPLCARDKKYLKKIYTWEKLRKIYSLIQTYQWIRAKKDHSNKLLRDTKIANMKDQ